MRILVVSDSHGNRGRVRDALQREPGCSLLIHLGDGKMDTTSVHDIPVLQVSGNCDSYCDLPTTILTEEGGKRIFCAHGHTFYVKYGIQAFRQEARRQNADIALYGHTHIPVQTYEDGLYICNPGALMAGDYAVLEILPNGVMWLPKRLY